MNDNATISNSETSSWLDRRTYTDLPPTAERSLRAAGLAFEDESVARQHLARARELAGDHPAVLTAEYRFFLYKHRYADAALVAERCLVDAARTLGVPARYHDVQRHHADFAQLEPGPRRWMYTLQAYAYVLFRAGQRDEARHALTHLIALDLNNQTKSVELLAVVSRNGEETDEG